MPALLTGLTNQPNQQYPVQLPDGSTATLNLEFWPQQLGWYYDLTWDGQNPAFGCNGNYLAASPNILRQFKNVLPFGISVITSDRLDPTDQQDFVNGACSLYLLNGSDVGIVESTFYPGS